MTVAEDRKKGAVEKGTAEASVFIGGTRYNLGDNFAWLGTLSALVEF
jgi:hypothetical protein